MHAVEDGWYWLAGAVPGNYGEKFHGRNLKMQHYKDDGTFDDYRESTPEECLKVLAKHLRISVEQAAQLTKDIVIEKLSDAELKKLSVDEVHLVEKALRREAKGRFKEFVETQLTRWMDEARECTNKHCLEVY